MTTPAQPRILLGVAFMVLASSLFPVMNGLVQWLSPRYPSEQIIWARITGQFLLMLAIMLPAAGLTVFATRRPGLQIARSLCQLTSTSLYFIAVATVPLAKAAAIGFLAPFIVALLAWPLLGERPKLRRLLTVAAAFLGVLVVIRPGAEGFQPASLLILVSASVYALYQVLTRKVAPHDGAETSTLWSALLGAVLLTLLLPFFWTTPTSLADALAFLGLGVLATAGHYCVARALSYGPAAVISPFQYWQIIGAVLMGVAITGLWPDRLTWAGAAIVIGAGIVLALSERRSR
ncbi:DMT family transporter [Falsiroseomonas oryziterrae]|uniref:DMT family transporter n=1 Tax=Falsiroseomonas oryziterrae TaxID=2911368 RepID=UPI001F1DE1DE|nr:DMT family transporter [Roseomonas sp. NPKOSM-4]